MDKLQDFLGDHDLQEAARKAAQAAADEERNAALEALLMNTRYPNGPETHVAFEEAFMSIHPQFVGGLKRKPYDNEEVELYSDVYGRMIVKASGRNETLTLMLTAPDLPEGIVEHVGIATKDTIKDIFLEMVMRAAKGMHRN